MTSFLAYPVLIEVAGTTGSGFHLYGGDFTFLVSARHVLFKGGVETHTQPVTITTLDQHTLVSPIVHTLDCPALFEANHLMMHPDSDVDIAVCRFGSLEHRPERGLYNFEMTPVSGVTAGDVDISGLSTMGISNEMTSLLHAVEPGESIYLIGYPTSLAKGDTALSTGYPLLRSGIVAGKPPSNRIIIDCATYPGNSGALVLRASDHHAIGVAVRNIGFTEHLYSSVDKIEVSQRRHNTGYTVVEPMDRVFETIKEIVRFSNLPQADHDGS